MTEVVFTRVPITGLVGCCVPVLPGTPDADAPLAQRTELCAVDADWMVGMVPTCDVHAQYVCNVMDIDWPELVAESGRDLAHASRSWSARQRHSQENAREHQARFTGA